MRDWKVYHFHDTSESARIKQPGRTLDADILLPRGENLAAFLSSIRDTSAYALMVRTIQRVEPLFLDFVREPELGLHPHALQILAGMLRTASGKTQIIASTQSVKLANEFSWEDLVVDRVKDVSRFRRLEREDVEQWLDDYALGELSEKNILEGSP